MVRVAAVEPDPDARPVRSRVRAARVAPRDEPRQDHREDQAEQDDGGDPARVAKPRRLAPQGSSEDARPAPRTAIDDVRQVHDDATPTAGRARDGLEAGGLALVGHGAGILPRRYQPAVPAGPSAVVVSAILSGTRSEPSLVCGRWNRHHHRRCGGQGPRPRHPQPLDFYAEHLPGGDNYALVGVALGAYGLTQAILQVPFGWLSDRFGRKPVIYGGLILFAIGSFIAGSATDIYWVIFGRIIQGSGAISAAIMALAADLTREEHRTKAMATIGMTIGVTFALSLIIAPALNRMIGVPGIFVMTGVLALLAMVMVSRIIPDPAISRFHSDTEASPGSFKTCCAMVSCCAWISAFSRCMRC